MCVRAYGIFSGDRVRGIFRKIFRTRSWNANDNVFAICVGVCFIISSVKCAGLLPVVQCLVKQFEDEKDAKICVNFALEACEDLSQE